jgi:hypothetical protein
MTGPPAAQARATYQGSMMPAMVLPSRVRCASITDMIRHYAAEGLVI